MKSMNKKLWFVVLFVLSLLISLYGFMNLKEHTYLWQDMLLWESIRLYIEHGTVFILSLLSLIYIRGRYAKLYALAAIALFYLQLHQIFIALLVVSILLVGFMAAGELILLKLRVGYITEYLPARLLNDFLYGSLIYIIIVCLLSSINVADIKTIRILSLGFCVVSIAVYFLFKNMGIIPLSAKDSDNCVSKPELTKYIYISVLIALAFSAVLMQAGRLNISLDYDSLRYGLRSLWVLVGEGGIYDKLGTVNDVYVYPKGLEILALPLNTKYSYSLVLAFSFIASVLMLMAVYVIVLSIVSTKTYINHKKAISATATVALIPAVMNMSISAKTDMITLLIQLIAIMNFILYIKSEDEDKTGPYLIYSMTAIISSILYKPTSLLFSFGLFVAICIYLIYKKSFKLKIKDVYILIYPISAVSLVFARTFILTGHIITSVYSSVWYKIGIGTHFPYTIDGYNSSGMNVSTGETVDMLYRLYQLFVVPSSQKHIYIAQPGSLILILLVLLTIYTIIGRHNKVSEAESYKLYLWLSIAATAFWSLLSLYIVYQIDGNYFILLFVLIIIVAYVYMEPVHIKYIIYAISPAFIYAFLLISVTNWAGVKGLSPDFVIFKDLGIYNHLEENVKAIEESDFKSLYLNLKQKSGSRTLLMSDNMDFLKLDIDMRTYTDVTGSGGNVALVKTLVNFKKYLDYAGIDYICTEFGFLEEHPRAKEIIKFMLEDGSLIEDMESNSMVLYKYNAY